MKVNFSVRFGTLGALGVGEGGDGLLKGGSVGMLLLLAGVEAGNGTMIPHDSGPDFAWGPFFII